MGYEVSAYYVEPEVVTHFVGSGDRESCEAVVKTRPFFISRRDAAHAPATPIRDALFGLCDGTVGDEPYEGWRYRYALESLCAHFGTRDDDTIRLSPEGIRASGELELLLRTKLPVTLPSVRDFPQTGFLPRGIAEVRCKKLADPASVPKWATWPEALAEECSTYVGWMRRADALGRDIWFFYY